MKFGVREICDVVLRAKKTMEIGNMKFYKDMPVFYFDSLKTSTLESASTTVYATGGKGNSRLIAWEGEKTLTFTMEDALISVLSLSILSGAGVLNTTGEETPIHATETIEVVNGATEVTYKAITDNSNFNVYVIPLDDNGDIKGSPRKASVEVDETQTTSPYKATLKIEGETNVSGIYLLDYYYKTKSNVTMIDITPDKFAGNYYLEAATLFRNKDGIDMPAEFIIPNCKIQSNFTFTMASSGDPSTFTFTMDAFPDYTKYDKTKKVLAAIQVLEDSSVTGEDETPVEAELTYTTLPAGTETVVAEDGNTYTKADLSNGVDMTEKYYTLKDEDADGEYEATEANTIESGKVYFTTDAD